MDDHIYVEGPDETPRDFLGSPIKVGDRLLRATCRSSNTAFLERHMVTKINNGLIYLDDSKVPVRRTEHCVNISYLRTMDSHLWETKA